MKYTEEFINEVKTVYPKEKTIINLAETNNPFLGRYLDDSSQKDISVDEILLLTNLDELQKKARVLKRKRELYHRWLKENE